MSPVLNSRQNVHHLFYCKGSLAVELKGDTRWRLLRVNGLFLAQSNQKSAGLPCALAACDQQHSVLSMSEDSRRESQVYSPYGHHTRGGNSLSLLAFNGEQPDSLTGHYHLGHGYRQFSSVTRRFCSVDSWSPFGNGGLNAYAYCAGDPINRTDPTGHFWGIEAFFKQFLGMQAKAPKASRIPPTAFASPKKRDNVSIGMIEVGGGEAGRRSSTLSGSLYDLDFDLFEPATAVSRRGEMKLSLGKKNSRHDSVTSEFWADLESRFEALKIKGAPPKPKLPAPGTSATWPRARPASKNQLDFTGNYIDKEVYSLRNAYS